MLKRLGLPESLHSEWQNQSDKEKKEKRKVDKKRREIKWKKEQVRNICSKRGKENNEDV